MTKWSDLPEDVRAMARRAQMPDFAAWERKIRATGACANPIRMRGGRIVVDQETGELLDAFHTDDEPLGYHMIACGNRRESVCPSCSRTHSSDTYQIVKAGLVGGKGVPESVGRHPAVFVTLTAPSFGPVHTVHQVAGRDGQPRRCRVRRDAPKCAHGVAMACTMLHEKGDEAVGQALCLDCYDYTGAVLFNAYAGELWRRLTIYLRRDLARSVGLSANRFGRVARLSFGKVAEYQARGVVHFHAVIRLDGPDGPATEPPPWATVDLLTASLTRVVGDVRVHVPSRHGRSRALEFGKQLDIQPITDEAETTPGGMNRGRVAGYVAKYVTKGAETTGTHPRRITRQSLDLLRMPPHAERMIRTCFALAAKPEHADLLLDRWAHMLGYRGHVTTKSRSFSATYGQLRADRRAHQDRERREAAGLKPLDGRHLLVESQWRFVRSGLAYGERPFVDSSRQRQRAADSIRQNALPEDLP